MSPKRRRHRATDKRVERTEERTSVGEGTAAQRYAAFQEHARAASSLRGRWVAGLSFTPDPFQLDALDAVEAGNSVLVAAPTGAGKTIVGQFGAYVALQRGMRAFYTTPIKALSNQKYLELCDLYGADNVGLATGDTSINSKAPVVIMTTEVCRNMIYAGASLDDLGVVVLDEVHYLADKMRGPVWEEVIIHLPAHVSIIALSATVSNAEEFGAWIREVRSSCEIIVSEQRPVPLYQHMIVGEDIFDLYAPTGKRKLNPELVAATNDSRMRGGRGSRSWNRPVRVRRESRPSTLISLDRAHLLPAITFIFSRAGCEDAVRQVLLTRITLTTRSEAAEIERYVDEVIALIAPEDAVVLGVDAWKRGLMRGIAAHHAGMLPLMKEAVEHLFSQGLVKMVYATETLAWALTCLRAPSHRIADEVERIGARVALRRRVYAAVRTRGTPRHRHRGARCRLPPRGSGTRGGCGARVQTYLSADLCVHTDLQHGRQPAGPLNAHADPKGFGVLVRTVPG